MGKYFDPSSLVQETRLYPSQESQQEPNFPFLDEENTALYRLLAKVLKRWPSLFGNDVAQAFHRFIGHLEASFQHPRSSDHLIKIFCSHYLTHKTLDRIHHSLSEKREIQIRLVHTRLQFHFKTKAVLGLVIAISIKDVPFAIEEAA